MFSIEHHHLIDGTHALQTHKQVKAIAMCLNTALHGYDAAFSNACKLNLYRRLVKPSILLHYKYWNSA